MRRFKLGFNNWQLAKEHPFAQRLFNPLDPVLQQVGRKKEHEWELSLRSAGLADLSGQEQLSGRGQETLWDTFATRCEAMGRGQDAYGREVRVAADIGAFRVEGRADFMLILWREGRPRLRIVECKASRRDRTYHRVQVALYWMIVRDLLRERPLRVGGIAVGPEDVECVVARIDESTNEGYSILELDQLNISTEEADLQRLLDYDGSLLRIMSTDLNELSYQLDAKCDGCVFNVHCRITRFDSAQKEPRGSFTPQIWERHCSSRNG